jgi:hypothetical protein
VIAAAALAVALVAPAVAHATPAPVAWCGHDEVAANRTPDLNLSASEQVRMVYAVPADGQDDFAFESNGIARDAAWIDEWWRHQDPARTPRFDRYAFPGCTAPFADLDIGFVRLPHDAAFYATSDIYRLLTLDLIDAFPAGQKTVVYYAGTAADPDVCGIGPTASERLGGVNGIAYVFLGSACELRPTGSGPSAEVAAHELIHDLGALEPGAPHACPDTAGHPCDSATDILYPYLGGASSLEVVTLDYNRDDYYGHSGSWWDVQDSPWLSHLPQMPFALTITGSGSVQLKAGEESLPCSSGCTGLALDADSVLDGLAIPDPGWRVGGWSGGCAASAGPCRVEVTGPTQVTVTFVRAPVDVSVGVRGQGRVTSTPTGIACRSRCTHTFKAGTVVRLAATAARGWRFAGWSGACTGRGACSVRGEGGDAVARFVRK